MLDFRVNTFLTVCRHMNYTKAAAELNITQPAVTQHIKYLQNYYGVKLFIYRDKNLFLTPEGEALRLAKLTQIHDEKRLVQALREMGKGRRSIRFGTTLSIGEYEIPGRLAAYMKQHPDVDVHMIVNRTQVLLQQLDSGFLDFAIVEGYYKKNEYDYLQWSMEPYICVCAGNHKLPATPLRLEDLFQETLILRDQGSGTREVLVRELEGHNFEISNFRRVVEISDLQVIKTMIMEDCGITFLYRKAVAKELENGTIREVAIDNVRIFHEFTFLWRKNSIFENEYRELFCELSGKKV